MLEAIKRAGVVGAGGAGFPTHVKLNASAEFVIVNGAECEPLLRVDQELMATKAEEVVSGLKIAMTEVGATKGVICLKEKYKTAIKQLTIALKDEKNIDLKTLKNVYPAGDEQYLVYDTTNRIVPEGGIPLNVGVVVINVETLINVHHAVNGQNVTHKYVTVTGAIKTPKTLYVPVGSSLTKLIAACGGTTISDYKIIDGGPMMGKMITEESAYVKKTSKGYIILPSTAGLVVSKEKSLAQTLKEAKTACCHCSLCTDVCPRYLLGHKLNPDKLMRIASYGSLGDKHAALDEAYLCCECGLCEIACIMNLQPWKLNQSLKVKLKESGVKNSNTKSDLSAHPFYDYRGFPVKKLINRIGLSEYDSQASIVCEDIHLERVRIYASQHIGAPGKCMVSMGQEVSLGELVYASKENSLSASAHASVSGTVDVISEQYIEIKI